MFRFNDLLDNILAYNKDASVELLQKAYVFSAKVHQGQTRLSGEPYLIHPLEVAHILTKMKLDDDSIVVGLLHDVVEDTYTTIDEIQEMFGEDIATMVDGVTKISKIENRDIEDRKAENFRKMIIAMANDIRVILVKLADRIHNMRTMSFQRPERKTKISQETMDVYAPIANRLGVSWIKSELEDLSFMYLQPEMYERIATRFKKTKSERQEYIKEVIATINQKLAEYNIKAKISGREKHYYSIYQKMEKRGLTFDQIHDIIAFRVIVADLKDCYEVLGIVHSMWKPVPGKFKDYIGLPKPNMYQSLHSTMIGPYGERLEVQIRTQEMHKIAEEGVAAHWRYKAGAKIGRKDGTQFEWINRIREWQEESKDSAEFMDIIKEDLAPEKMIYIFTPRGDVKEFPSGSTPVDFAYSIHSQVGNQCMGAKIGNKIVPLKHELKNGDTVEIITSTTQKPSKDWLNFVKTSRARTRIRQFLKAAERESSITLGKSLCEKEFKRFNLSVTKMTKSGTLKDIAKEFNFRDEDTLLASVGFGKVTPVQILGKALPHEELEKVYKKKETKLSKVISKFKKKKPKQRSAVKVLGMDNLMVRYAKCCSPVSGEPIIGYITRGRGVAIHTKSCKFAKAMSDERSVAVSWDVQDKLLTSAMLSVRCDDKKGILAEIANTISKTETNIADVKVRIMPDKTAICTFKIEVLDIAHLQKNMSNIQGLKGVISVERKRR